MSVKVFHRDTCRLCAGRSHDLGLSLEPTPIGDDFVPERRLREVQETFPLDLFVCRDCGNVQLLKTLDPEVVYGDYLYTSSTSVGLPEHFQGYADHVMRYVNPPAHGLVVELGSNEGAMLHAFRNNGMRVLGIDPAAEIARRATAAGLETLATFFSAKLAAEIRAKHGPASIVVANNVFANIDDLDDMAEGIRTLLAEDGVFVFETSYLLDVVQKNLIDTIFHEHLCYFAVKPLQAYFRRCGMRMIKAERVQTKGGSLRGYVQRDGAHRQVEGSVAKLVTLEVQGGVDRPEALQELGRRLGTIKRGLTAMLDDLKAKGKSVAAYGAAVGLTTMIYHFDLEERIAFIVDDSPNKQNTFSPGHHIPVYAPQALNERKPDYVLILAWRYVDNIIGKNQAYLDRGGRFIVPLPELKVV